MFNNLKLRTASFLRWSQRYTKTDMVYLVKNGSWLFSKDVIGAFIALGLSVVFANYLPKEVYGEYKYILSIVAIITVTALPGLNLALTQSVARGYEGTVCKVFQTKLLWAFLGSLCLAMLGGYYYINGNTVLAVSFFIAGIGMPVMEASQIFAPFLNGKKYFPIATKYSLLSLFITSLALGLAVIYTNKTWIILFVYFVAYSATRYYYYRRSINKYPPNNQLDPDVIKYGKELSYVQVFTKIANNIDKLIIFHFFGAAEVAVYMFAILLPKYIKKIFKHTNSLALPKISQKQDAVIKKDFLIKMGKYSIILGLATVTYVVLAPTIFKILFPTYTGAIIYSQIFAITILLSAQTLLKTYLKAKKQIKYIYYLETIIPLIRILLLVVLTPLYGIAGVLGAIITTQLLGYIYNLYLFKQA